MDGLQRFWVTLRTLGLATFGGIAVGLVGCGTGTPEVAPFSIERTIALHEDLSVFATYRGRGVAPAAELLETVTWPRAVDQLVHQARRVGQLDSWRVELDRSHEQASGEPVTDSVLDVEDKLGEVSKFVRDRARDRQIPGRQVLLVGWDGADPRVVEDLLKAGLLPNLKQLRERGAYGHLASHAPYLSPLLWTSVATGKRPQEHGVLDFVERGVGGDLQPVGAGCRRSTTLWEVASDLGKRVLVVNWWATEPAEDLVNGEVISDRAIRGAEAQSSTDERETASSVIHRLIRGEPGSDSRVPTLHGFVVEALLTQRHTLRGIATHNPDLVLTYYGLIDQSAHLFVREMAPQRGDVSQEDFARFGGVVHGSYLLLDTLLGELVTAMPANTAVVVMSDHGFVYGVERHRTQRVKDDKSDLEHAKDGIYVVAGDVFTAGAGPTLDLYDITPLTLPVLGLPPADDMAGRVPTELIRTALPASVPTHETNLSPPRLHLLDGETCSASPVSAPRQGGEELRKLEALGYLSGPSEGLPSWPLANYGRALLDAGEVELGIQALTTAVARNPHDSQLGLFELEALLTRSPGDSAVVEQAARRQLRSDGAKARPEVAFVLIQLLLRSSRDKEAEDLAAEIANEGIVGHLAQVLVRSWTADGDRAAVAAQAAAAIDPVRTVDTIQGLSELFADRELRLDVLLAGLAPSLPMRQLMSAEVSALTSQPGPTLERARQAQERAVATRAVATTSDLLWLRRARAYEARRLSSERNRKQRMSR